MERLCERCNSSPAMREGRWYTNGYCRPCLDAIKAEEAAPWIAQRKVLAGRVTRTEAEKRLRLAAHRFVAVALRCGFLPILDGSQTCVDCGAVATDYEHRDYARPLDVEPVCRACNARRGMGAMPPRVVTTD